MPYAQSYLQRKPGEWTPIYRLYYGSMHWVSEIVEGFDGLPWYRIKDKLIGNENLNYYIPARQARLILPEET